MVCLDAQRQTVIEKHLRQFTMWPLLVLFMVLLNVSGQYLRAQMATSSAVCPLPPVLPYYHAEHKATDQFVILDVYGQQEYQALRGVEHSVQSVQLPSQPV